MDKTKREIHAFYHSASRGLAIPKRSKNGCKEWDKKDFRCWLKLILLSVTVSGLKIVGVATFLDDTSGQQQVGVALGLWPNRCPTVVPPTQF